MEACQATVVVGTRPAPSSGINGDSAHACPDLPGTTVVGAIYRADRSDRDYGRLWGRRGNRGRRIPGLGDHHVDRVAEVTDRRAVALAGHIGDVPTATAGLASTDPTVRATALGALLRLDHLTSEILTVALTDADPGVRRRAAQLAAGFPDVVLTGALRDSETLVAEMAAWACGEHEVVDDETLGLLIELGSKHREPLVREAAIAALGAIGDERGLATILKGCSDKPAIRRRSVIALAPFEGPEVEAALAKALTDKDWQVRDAAEELGN
jgi:HEAT repeat protein